MSDADDGGRAVDTALALSTDAGDRAFRKWPHHGAAGSTDLDWRAGVKSCGGKLLTAYVREKGQRYGEPTRWVKVGVVCRGCSAWWPLAVPEAGALA